VTTFEIGQTITAGPYLNYVNGVLTDTGSLPTCTVTKPDGTTTPGVVTKTATGTYVPSFAGTALAGRHRLTLSGGTSNNGGLPWSDVADVWPADPRLIISLADAKAELNHISDVNNDELRLYIAATTQIVEDIIGPVLATTESDWLDGGSPVVMVDMPPIASVTSVTETYGAGVTRTLSEQPLDGSSFDAYGYTVDKSSGKITRRISGVAAPFAAGRANIHVTYVSGYAGSVPPNVVMAARIIAAHLYQVGQQSRSGRGRSGAQPEDLVMSPSGFAVPARAVEALNPTLTFRGLA